jgi:alpha-beta hydrolase superfamily lysophospholipase
MSTSEMTVTELSWKAPDGNKFYAVEWRPIHPRASVVLVHGLGEHCRRYNHVAQAFCSNGIGVLGFDHRGHGRSEGKRGHIPGMKRAMEDIDHFVQDAQTRFPGLPLFLYGHSMGGLMVLNFALTRRPSLSGVVCTSPGLATGQPVAPFKLFLGNLLYSLMPSFTMDNGLDVENLSHDPKVVEAYKKDHYVTPLVSSALGLDIIRTGRWVEEHGEDFNLPLLLLQGTGDHVVSPEATRRFAARVPRDLINYQEFKGLYHELHNEYEKADVLSQMTMWMETRVRAD